MDPDLALVTVLSLSSAQYVVAGEYRAGQQATSPLFDGWTSKNSSARSEQLTSHHRSIFQIIGANSFFFAAAYSGASDEAPECSVPASVAITSTLVCQSAPLPCAGR